MATAQKWLDKKYPIKKGVKKIEIKEVERGEIDNNDNHLIIADFPDLEEINFTGTKITELEVKKCPQLFFLSVENNELKKLALVDCPWLATLTAHSNQLTSLDLTQNLFNLTKLVCFSNQLTSLDISNNRKLNYLCCDDNLQPIRDLTIKIEARTKSLSNTPNSEKDQLEAEIQTLKDLKERLEKQESGFLTKINDLKIELKTEKEKTTNLETEYQELMKQLENIKSELALTPSTPHPEKQTLKDKINYFNNFLKKNKQERDDLRENIKKEQKQSQEIRNSLLSLENQLKDRANNSEEIDNLTQANQTLKKQLSDLTNNLSQQKDSVKKLEKENEDLQTKIETDQLLNEEKNKQIPYGTYFLWGMVAVFLVIGGFFGYKWARKGFQN